MRASNKLRLAGTGIFFGPGSRDLLLNIDKLHSIQAACKEMDLSYTKALRIIKVMEDELGFVVVHTEKGGNRHGGSSLTEEGRQFLAAYQSVEQKLDAHAQKLVEEAFSFLAPAASENPAP